MARRSGLIRFVRGLLVLGALCLCTATLWSGDSPAIPKISAFAPAADLIQQLDFFLGRVKDSVAEPADFEGANQSRTLKDANTLAALALMLAVHDQDHPLKQASAALLSGAQSLAAADADGAKAQAAFARLQAARGGQAEAEPEVRWEKAASLSALMKAVPLVHTGLKRGVEPSRLARQKVQSAGQAAALAAIAQAAMLDPEYAKTPEDARDWTDFCTQMRDAAGEVNSAVHAQDQARVAEGMKRLTQSCDACHARFRHE